MRVITVRQPWAWAIAHGGKHIENRSTGAAGWRYRGLLAIHAAAGWSQRGAADARVRRAWERRTGLTAIDPPERVGGVLVHRSIAVPDPRSRIHFGAVIAVAELVDVHPDSTFGCCRPWGESTYPNTGTPGVVQQVTHLVLEDVRPLPDDGYPARGRLGLWAPDDDLAEELQEVAHA